MRFLKQVMATSKRRLLSEKGFALALIVAGAFFVAVGSHQFSIRPARFGVPSFLGCVVGAFGAFFLLLITDYVIQHAPVVIIPWLIFLIYFAFVQPHFAGGVGIALWFMLVEHLRA